MASAVGAKPEEQKHAFRFPSECEISDYLKQHPATSFGFSWFKEKGIIDSVAKALANSTDPDVVYAKVESAMSDYEAETRSYYRSVNLQFPNQDLKIAALTHALVDCASKREQTDRSDALIQVMGICSFLAPDTRQRSPDPEGGPPEKRARVDRDTLE
jgi:hypothetical protein